MLLASLVFVAVALGVGRSWLTTLGIEPTAHSYGAAMWTLLGYLAIHLAIRTRTEAVGPLLNAMFGLFAWAAHLLVIYTVTATACQTALRYANHEGRSGLAIALALVTVAAAAIVVVHAVSRHRQFREDRERQFRLWVTIGSSALATIAIVWQLFAFVLVPLCA